MATFLRLKLRGVRSVGDEEENVHYIKFLSPCTLISGPNGTGKTTTIEALNYITTGALPTGKLSAFIQSNDMAKKARVDASVTLEFLDVKKRVCTATRRMSSTLGGGKDKKAVTKSEEFTLNIKYPDGNSHSISSKVCDFEKAMFHHLGVPKAIFNHVIFCHQEDSTWPLSEPKELKLKFDQIFQLTKFVNAQKQMKSLRLTYGKDKEIQHQIQLRCEDLIRTKLEAKHVEKECTKKKQNGEATMERIKEEKNGRIEEREGLEKKIQHAEKCLREIERNEVELRSLHSQLNIVQVPAYHGTEQQLQDEIRELEQETSGHNYMAQQETFSNKIKAVESMINRLMVSKRRIENEVADLRADAKHRDSIIDEINKMENSLRKELGVQEGIAFEVALNNAIEARLSKMEESLRITSDGVDEFQNKVDEEQKVVTRIECEMKILEKEKVKLQKETGDIERKLNSIDGASSRVEYLSNQSADVERELENLPKGNGESMNELISERKNIQEQLNDLERRCGEAERFADTEKEIMKKKQETTEAKQKLDKLKQKHEPNWDALYGDADRPQAPWTSAIKEADEEIRSGLKSVENQLKDAQLAAQRSKTIIQQLHEEERKISFDISDLKSQIYEECGCKPENVAVRLDEVRLKLKLARKQLSPIDAKIILYDSWISETAESSCCPVCERKFSSKSQTNIFTHKLQDQSINFPKEKEQLEKEVLKAEEEEMKLVKAENQAQELKKMGINLQEVLKKQRSNNDELKGHEGTIAETTQGQHEFTKNLRYITALSADISLMDNLHEQIEKLSRELKELNGLMRKREGKTSYLGVKEEISQKQQSYQRVVKKCDELQKTETQRNVLQAKLNKLRDEKLTLGENSAQASHYRDQLTLKEEELKRCTNKYETLRRELPAAQKKVEIAQFERIQRNDERRQMEVEMQSKVNYFEQKKSKFSELSSKLERTTQSENEIVLKSSELEKIESDLSMNQKKMISLEVDKNQLDGSQTKRRLLNDQLARMTIEAKIRQVKEDIETLRKLGADRRKTSEMKESYDKVSKELIRLNQEEVRTHTILETNETMLKQALHKLSLPDIKRAEEAYRDVLLEICLLTETISDVEKYLKCLDQSLIKFHTEKMAAVNEILDDLWRKVYNSTDIESIKIRTNTNEETAKNRAYDYSVVMIQDGGKETEMRGRCSAGQKMLASLLIRISLAEVFGGLCSMIALDEPTTNLDDEKVEGMADILNELIEARQAVDEFGNQRGRNMQMVVITHDERLVNKLTLACRPEYIYCLAKNEHGLSHLKKRFPDGSEVTANNRA